MENSIQMLRLKNGEDIIGCTSLVSTNYYHVKEPMVVLVKNQGLLMQNWLPVQLLKKNEATLSIQEVLGVFEPTDEFIEYYNNTIEKINRLIEAQNRAVNMTDNEIQEAVLSLEDIELGDNQLH